MIVITETYCYNSCSYSISFLIGAAMEQKGQADLLKRLESGYSFPALSIVAIRLIELASDDACSVTDLSDLIEKDSSLAIRLLKVANSAFFRTTRPVTTLKQAIIRIGFHRLRVMALTLSLRDTFPMGKVGGFDYERFWRASLYRALLAKSLAEQLNICNPEEAFVGGLTLGAGFLIFFDVFIKNSGMGIPADLSSLETLLVWEKDTFGVHHREIGEVALRYWKFPEPIINCQSGYLPTIDSSPLSRICDLARVISTRLLGRSMAFYDLYGDGRKCFGLQEDVMNTVILSVFEETEAVAEALRVEMDKERDLLSLMEKANRALSTISEKIAGQQTLGGEDRSPTFETLKEQKERQEVVSETLQAVAHEIRNPLAAVAGFARRLFVTLDPQSKSGAYARIILEEAERLEKALSHMGA